VRDQLLYQHAGEEVNRNNAVILENAADKKLHTHSLTQITRAILNTHLSISAQSPPQDSHKQSFQFSSTLNPSAISVSTPIF